MGERGPMVFELSVEGALGPMLRQALLPGTVVWSGGCTVLRVSAPGRDLAGLVAELTALDLSVDSVCTTAS